MVGAHKENDSVTLTLQGRRVSRQQLQQDLRRIAMVNTNITVYLKTLTSLSLGETLEILKTIKASGLLNVVLMSKGLFAGETGDFVFPIRMQTNGVFFCTLVQTNDFVSDVIRSAPDPVQLEQRKAEPTNAPYSSPAPRVQKRRFVAVGYLIPEFPGGIL